MKQTCVPHILAVDESCYYPVLAEPGLRPVVDWCQNLSGSAGTRLHFFNTLPSPLPLSPRLHYISVDRSAESSLFKKEVIYLGEYFKFL